MALANPGRRIPSVGCLIAALLAACCALPSRAQDAGRLERSMDDLQYQMKQFDSELAKLRKAVAQPQPPGPRNVRSRADSLLPGLNSRLDSLAERMSSLENRVKSITPVPAARAADQGNIAVTGKARSADSAPAPAAPLPGSAPAQGMETEIQALRTEMRALTVLLAETRLSGEPATVHAQRAPSPSALALPPGPALPPAPAVPAPSAPSAPSASPGLAFLGDIQIQGIRRLATGAKQDNLDDFWGRVNLGAEYKGKDFQSKANIRIFPEGFGFEPLTGATFDTTGQGALKTQTQPSSKVVVNHAWVRFTPCAWGLRMGRFETQESQSASYGNYIDLGPSGAFLARPAVHNALEGTWSRSAFSSSLLLGSGDRKLDKGFVRALEKATIPGGLQASLGYRANVFDRVMFPDAEILQRYDAGLLSPVWRGWQAFAEAALLQNASRDDETPVLLGLKPPGGRFLDALSLELEWLRDRKVKGKSKELFGNAYFRKAWGRARMEAGIASDASDPDANAFTVGLRVTSTLK
jgi:hypothetical protein